MDITNTIALENDGLNMTHDGKYLYVRCKRSVYKFNEADMSIAAKSVVFSKDGKARSIAQSDNYIVITDFCELYILNKSDLHTEKIIRIGKDASSDLISAHCRGNKAYISVRNGYMAVCDLESAETALYCICKSSSWDFCIDGNVIYMGTTEGELYKIDADTMKVISHNKLCVKNIYSVMYDGGILYTVSQDMSLKAIDAHTLSTVCENKRAVRGMTRIAGVFADSIMVADGGISCFDRRTLELGEHFDLPTGQYNKGVLLAGEKLYCSDKSGIKCVMPAQKAKKPTSRKIIHLPQICFFIAGMM